MKNSLALRSSCQRRLGLLVLVLCVTSACSRPPTDPPNSEPPTANSAPERPANREPRTAASDTHLQSGPQYFTKGSARFEWRGISAFRLAEMIAHGREREAAAYLDWAAGQKLTVVRVLLMAHHLFQLTPDEGLRAAPRLLELAAERGLHVELVALADSDEIDTDLEQHVTAVGAAAAAHPNALVEIANEPWHSTQDRRLHDPSYVRKLAELVPAGVPVALGSAEKDADYAAAGTYATWHAPRGGADAWRHVLAHAEGAELVSTWKKPVISDEPIGAHSDAIRGRRDNSPARFAAAAAVARLAGLGATFHYEGGLQARTPSGTELACLEAWAAGLDLLRDLPEAGRFLHAAEVPQVAKVRNVRAAFARQFDDELWVVAVDPNPDASVEFAGGWRLRGTRASPGVRLYRGGR